MDELQRLIMEQARDMEAGFYQAPEPNTIPLGEWERHLGEEGFDRRTTIKIDGRGWECVVHGREDIVRAPDSWIETNGRYWRCRECSREYKKQDYLKNKDKRIATNVARQKERYATDPEFRAKRAEYNRRAREKRLNEHRGT